MKNKHLKHNQMLKKTTFRSSKINDWFLQANDAIKFKVVFETVIP